MVFGDLRFPLPPGNPFQNWVDWLPVATVIPFAGIIGNDSKTATTNIASWGWMVCDGRSLSTNQYPYLFAAIGYLYGGSGNQFKIPDYRGYFLRGLDPDKSVDKDPRSPPPGGSDKDPGSTQLDAIQTHEHIYKAVQTATTANPGQAAGPPSGTPTLTEGGPTSSLTPPGDVRVSPNETRPVNIAVNILIKYTYLRPGNPGPVLPEALAEPS